MKIYINNSNENWICDRMRKEFIQKNSQHITYDMIDADVVWLFSNWIWRQTPIEILKNKKVATTIHHIDPEKIDLNDFMLRDQFIDAYHVFSEKTIEHFPQEVDLKKVHVVPYWYNADLWKLISEKDNLRKKFNIPADQFTIGSFQRDTEGSDLKTPKLSKGPDIFCDIVEKLDSKPHVVLAGWRRQYVINRLESAKIPYSYFEMASFETLNELYNCLDLYLVTSRHEGGPQAILECASNYTPILSTDVGFSRQVLNENSICKDQQEFVKKIKSKDFNLTDYNYQKLQDYNMEKVMPLYIDFFKQI
jgi:glycosyltransferase involved in cell wall biosynthesis